VDGDVLVLRLSSLGDVVIASSFLDRMARAWPESRVTFVVREDWAEIAAALPGVARVVAVPRRLGLAGLLALGRDLARTRWAHVFDLHQSVRSRLLTWAVRPRLRPGFDKQLLPRWILLTTRRDVYARLGGARSMRERMLVPLQRLGVPVANADTRLVIPAAVRRSADSILDAAGVRADHVCIAIAPGARWPSKRWLADRFRILVEVLAAADPKRRMLLVGGPEERALAAATALGAPDRAVALAGHASLMETAAILARSQVVVANDSGLLHVAEAVGRPVVAIFGPTAPQFGYAPCRSDSTLLREPPACSPCSKNGSRPCIRPTHECMEAITVEAVAAAVERTLELGRGVRANEPSALGV
jgi:lipopolysaccharide heptosyltransferase II